MSSAVAEIGDRLATIDMSISYCHVQRCCRISMFLTNNSPDLYALTLCSVFRKKCHVISIPRISANSNENLDVITSQTFANISGKFPEIINFRKVYNPTNVTDRQRSDSKGEPFYKRSPKNCVPVESFTYSVSQKSNLTTF